MISTVILITTTLRPQYNRWNQITMWTYDRMISHSSGSVHTSMLICANPHTNQFAQWWCVERRGDNVYTTRHPLDVKTTYVLLWDDMNTGRRQGRGGNCRTHPCDVRKQKDGLNCVFGWRSLDITRGEWGWWSSLSLCADQVCRLFAHPSLMNSFVCKDVVVSVRCPMGVDFSLIFLVFVFGVVVRIAMPIDMWKYILLGRCCWPSCYFGVVDAVVGTIRGTVITHHLIQENLNSL